MGGGEASARRVFWITAFRRATTIADAALSTRSREAGRVAVLLDGDT
jgi:hypothetical protein